MRIHLLIFFLLFTQLSFAQIPKSGTYTYNYCDMEYNHCIAKCKVVIKGTKIWVYAPDGLTGIKEGELYEEGLLYKHRSGKWLIVSNAKEKPTELSNKSGDPYAWIDFKRKRFWTF
ncbi:hypothetical protein [Ferruginibacter sp.]